MPSRPPFVRSAAAALCALLLSAALPAAHAGLLGKSAPEPVVLDVAANPATTAEAVFDITDAAALKGLKRVVIPSFQVEFVTQSSAQASATQIGSTATANASLWYKLVGLSDADLQALTDRLYQDFVKDLREQGLEVLGPEQLGASAAYAKFAAAGQPGPVTREVQRTVSRVVAPTGLRVPAGADGGGGSINPLAAFAAGVAQVSGAMTLAEVANETQAAVLDLRVSLNFVDLQSSGSSWLNRVSGEASVKASMKPTLVAGATRLTVQRERSGGAITLQQPLILQGDAIGEVRDVSSLAANAGLALLNFAIGKGNSTSIKEMEAVAEPERYRSVVGEHFSALSKMFAARLAAQR